MTPVCETTELPPAFCAHCRGLVYVSPVQRCGEVDPPPLGRCGAPVPQLLRVIGRCLRWEGHDGLHHWSSQTAGLRVDW